MPAVETTSTDSGVRARVGAAEWQTRVELAACYRLVARYDMSDLIYNHITAKVPNALGHFLINPMGFLYEEMTASCFCKLDLEGNVVMQPEPGYPVNQAGFVIHGAVHGARPDLGCVLHTHTRAGMAVSAMKDGLLPLTQTSMRFYGAIGYHDYGEPTADIDERERLARDLGSHNAIILRNHGRLACGRDIGEAFNLMVWLENACKVQVDVLGSHVDYSLPSDALATSMARRYMADGPVMSKYAALERRALLRKLDRESPSYRD